MGKKLIIWGQLLHWLLEQAVVFAVGVLVLDVLWGVCTRFILGSPSRWTEEVATFLLIWVALLGAAVAFKRQEHLGVDYVVKKLEPSSQVLLVIAAQIVVILFAASAMIYGGYVLVTETLLSGQVTPALSIKMGYVYLAVPVSGVFIVLSCLERIAELLADSKSDQDPSKGQFTDSGEAV